MTTTEVRRIGPSPAIDDITRAVDRFAGLIHHRDRYPFACGAFGSILSALAELHARCRKTDCPTCWHLRRGLAYIAALDEGETP